MADGYTWCRDDETGRECVNLVTESTKAHPRYWLCSVHARKEGFGFVTNGAWDNFAPFLYCSQVNGGACPHHKWKESK